ncbi:hypothetical protein SCHPADRAFT_248092 [Schizopora paradoxa]|uniref:Polysaccharide lyase 14 domain-containing protein n=1 Tax=Schizopora paradoxa TaxID=27342 RepID=A0A0H2SF75_9AGAM|nr:hypothetical protein SCHPADRAFT_248092 [Schizopora paradoxa]
MHIVVPTDTRFETKFSSVFGAILLSFSLCDPDISTKPMTGLSALIAGCLLIRSIADAAVIRYRQPPAVQITWVTEYETSIDEVTSIALQSIAVETPFQAMNSSDDKPVYPFLAVPPIGDNNTDSIQDTLNPLPDVSTSFISKTFTETLYDGPETITVSIPPTTVTDIVTVSSAAPTNFWTPPTRFDNLDPFKILHFADGASNVQLTDDVTANVKEGVDNSSTIFTSVGDPLVPPPINTTFGSILQVLYPAGSVNPGNDPVGGADFYASPLNLDGATSVTLEYSVFFPSGFQWVKGGKLPGLYGGHMTCSGGDDATTCFSTRLMWRQDGAGELYLYAPKDAQTKSLCQTPPFSYCDEDYGLSIGRGSFNFSTDTWTTLRQTVTLNTPGQQDGGFLLEVDGRLAIHRSDVFYRAKPSPTRTSMSQTSDSSSTASTTESGLLGPLLGDVLRRLGLDGESAVTTDEPQLALSIPSSVTQTPMIDGNTLQAIPGAPVTTVTKQVGGPPLTVTSYFFENVKEQAAASTSLRANPQSSTSTAVGFSGLFFSTFFGGSSDDYATPVDQFVWFKDFSMVINF